MRKYKKISDLVQRHKLLSGRRDLPRGLELDRSIGEQYLGSVNHLFVESTLDEHGGDDTRLLFFKREEAGCYDVTGYQGIQKPTIEAMFEVTEVGTFGREATTETVAQTVNNILSSLSAPNSSAYVVFSANEAKVYRNASTEEIAAARAPRISKGFREFTSPEEYDPTTRTITLAIKNGRNLI